MKLIVLFLSVIGANAWQQTRVTSLHTAITKKVANTRLHSSLKDPDTKSKPSVEETVEKYGLEAGLFQSLSQKKDENSESSKGPSAKDLLAKYGVAYLATSIPLAIVSFVICYALVDNGVDVASLLAKVGINVNENKDYETAGTLAIAYAAHKAASPIRFPPTVLLTPVVAKLLGKDDSEEITGESSE